MVARNLAALEFSKAQKDSEDVVPLVRFNPPKPYTCEEPQSFPLSFLFWG